MPVQFRWLFRQANGTLTEHDVVEAKVPELGADITFQGTRYTTVAVINELLLFPTPYIVAWEVVT